MTRILLVLSVFALTLCVAIPAWADVAGCGGGGGNPYPYDNGDTTDVADDGSGDGSGDGSARSQFEALERREVARGLASVLPIAIAVGLLSRRRRA